jgi:amino acid adenylation domain-containing protein
MYTRFNPRQFRIDVRRAPLLRLYLSYDKKKQRWLTMQLMHHLVGDHSTLEVMQAEMQAHLLGQEAFLPAPLPFRNLVAQARLGLGPQEHEAFFRQMLGDVDEPTAPFGLLDVRGDGSGIEEAHLQLDSDLARRLHANARRLGVSAASLCHLAWARVLSKVSGRQDVVFGTVVFGRMQGGEGADRVMGPFINTLPVRIEVREEQVAASVRSTHALLAGLLRHEHASLALAQRCSVVPAPSPLFSALLNYRHSADAARAPSAETLRAWEGIRILRREERTNYPFTLSVNDLGQGFSLDAQTPVSIGPMRVCQFMRTALESLADALETSPATAVQALEVLPASERHRLLYEWNDTKAEYPRDKCVHELFEAQVDRTPDAIAVVYEGESLTYREVNRRANQLAHRLRKLGVGPEVIVGIFAERSVEMVVGLLATLKAGGAYLPLDPKYPADRLNFMLGDARPALVLVQRNLAAKWPHYAGEVVFLEDDFAAENDANPANRTQAENLAVVIYTSGSTGRPKGVMNTHRYICNWLLWLQNTYPASVDDRIIHKTPITFDVSLGEIFWSLIAGSQLVVAQPDLHGDSHYLIRTICEDGISIIHFVPSMLSVFLEDKDAARCSSLQKVFCAGEALSVDLQERFFAVLPKAELHNQYGPTEAGVVTYWPCQRGSSEPIVPIGWPVANTQIYILDRAMQPVPPTVTGELHIGGVQLARGYLARPELTAEKFVQNPFGEGRLYKTGDLARYRSDGAIEYLGRIDSQVKIRGFRVEVGEIETVLRQHPGVQESIVIAREDIPGDKRLVAYVVAREDTPGDERQSANVVSRNGALSPSELREYLRVKLPDYMVPATFVTLNALPLTPSGKVNHRALPAPERSNGGATGEDIQPINLLELELIRIWQRLFQRDDIGRQDNFFALGGHSLLATRLTAEIDKLLSYKLPIAALFQSPTIESLARRLNDGDCVPPWSSLVPLQPNGSKPPLFFVHGYGGDVYGFLDLAGQLGPDQPSFGIQPVGLDGKSARHLTVEDMAAHYVREIVSFQKDGPLYLAGYCLGGVFAFEIAQQLHRLGRRVALLALLDSSPIGTTPWFFYGMAMATYIPGRCLSHFWRFWKLPLRERLTYARGRWQALRYWMVERNRSKLSLVTAPLPLGSEPHRYPGSIDYYHAVALPYHLRSYPGSVDLFVSDAANFGRRCYWRHLARGGAAFHRVPGGHLEILSGENLPVLAKSLTAVIQRKQNGANLKRLAENEAMSAKS